MSYPSELICLRCDRQLDSIDGPQDFAEIHTPYNGTIFTTYGHYGSTIFDEMGDKFLSITLCDLCIIEKSNLILQGEHKYKIINNESHKEYSYTSFEETLHASQKEWVKQASNSLLIDAQIKNRVLPDGTQIELIKVTENNKELTAELFINKISHTLKKDDQIKINQDNYIVEFIQYFIHDDDVNEQRISLIKQN